MTDAGRRIWAAVEGCTGQIRMSPTGPLGLDFPAVIGFAALGGPMSPEGGALFEQVLPEVDAIVVKSLRSGGDE